MASTEINFRQRVLGIIKSVKNALTSDVWRVNGGWGQHYGSSLDPRTTAQIAYLLRRIESPQAVLKKTHQLSSSQSPPPESSRILASAAEKIASLQHADGGWGVQQENRPSNTTPPAEQTSLTTHPNKLQESRPSDTAMAILVLALHSSTQFEERLWNGLNYLSEMFQDGGWGSKSHPPTITTTANVVWCLDIAQHKLHFNHNIPNDHLDPPANFIMNLQNDHKGWRNSAHEHGSTDKATAYALFALASVYSRREGVPLACRQAIAWLRKRVDRKGYWGESSGDIETTAIAICGLLTAGVSPGSSIIMKPLKYLIDKCNDNPVGWKHEPDDEQVSTWATFYATLALQIYYEYTQNPGHIPYSMRDRLDDLLYSRGVLITAVFAFVLCGVGIMLSNTGVTSLLLGAQSSDLMQMVDSVLRLGALASGVWTGISVIFRIR